MTILDRYLVSRLVSTLAKAVFTLAGLYVLIDFLITRQSIVGRNQIPLPVVAEYYLTQMPLILFTYHAVALSLLIAALMVLGKAAQDQEIVAALAGGISLRRIAAGPLAVGLAASLGVFALQETWGVQAAARAVALDNEYFKRTPDSPRNAVSWAGVGDGWTCHILKFNRISLVGEDVYLHRMTENQFDDIRADRIYWDEDRQLWILEDGRRFTFDLARAWEHRVTRITQAPAPFGESPEALFALEEPADSKVFTDLARDLQRAEALGMPVQRHWVDFHAKFARPALCFIMVLLAVPFAMQLRRGGLAVSFGAAIALGFAYMMVFFVGVGLGWMGVLPPVVAAWLANGVFFSGGLWLLLRQSA